MKIGVLALQGAVAEHLRSLERIGIEGRPVRRAEEVYDLDGLILPGGESTTMGRLMRLCGVDAAIRTKVEQGMPVYGTCAGMILMANEIVGGEPPHLALMDLSVRRNASGRQVESYEVELPIAALGEPPFHAVFIRAPYIERVGADIEVLCEVGGYPVFARQGNLLASSFHPELTADDRVHRLFLDIVAKAQ